MKQVYVLPILLLASSYFFRLGYTNTFLQGVLYGVNADTELIVARQDTAVKYVREDDGKRKKNRKLPAVKTTKITMTRELQRATLSRRSDEGRHIEIVVMVAGQNIRSLDDLQLVGSSGTPVSSGNFLGFDEVELPFEGNVRFKAANKMNTAVYDREVRFRVVEPGRWVLKLYL